ncbi:MAG TPA: adenine phosphoribosyltransferase [Halanaerobiales bacterium]|nr:adenine phosphoribosyltransferase [Halanaerobiales bacterium]HPZ63461.1 adenine phosphoribosyltransferase [Halanaerobiales bacterium]HQD04339.1 adenine phosphoribosyltransferase [Halanaerobiales bacterium]
MDLQKFIRDIPDFPKEGIIFKDITPLLKDAAAFDEAINRMIDYYQNFDFDYIVGIEARGFLFGAPMAIRMGKGFIPIRKPGKLPGEILSKSYDLEYGSNEIEIHRDAIAPGDKVLIIDDLLATGGTIVAAVQLIEELGGKVAGIGFLYELSSLKGRELLAAYDVFSLMKE